MDQRISIVTLGVADLSASRRFYERLGWEAASASSDSITFFDLGGLAFGLFERSDLAKDAGVADDGSGFRGVTIAHNVRSEAAVDETLQDAVAAGAKLVKPGQPVFWGGCSGYFADPDGHLWEVAYNPFFPLDADGRLSLAVPVDATPVNAPPRKADDRPASG